MGLQPAITTVETISCATSGVVATATGTARQPTGTAAATNVKGRVD